ncbi:MAG TPA: competence/damage-inducible protein A [Gemmatimonadaceae bacterium]|nr:competence/damage-inducible protein A [Gemmatimonadaceae bacterium]
MHVELITIGDELLLGFVIDTNAAQLARELAAVGVEIVRRTTVPDDAEPIVAAVREALERTGAVITTGGLGPTSDDLTRPAVAALFGREMRLDERILAGIEARFRSFGLPDPMPVSNRQQALVPVGAMVLENRHGTAPGLWLEDESGRWVAMLPGVPREMRGLLADALLPMLRERAGEKPSVVLSRTIRTTGIGESALAELLAEYGRGFPGMPLAYNPKWAGTDLRLTAKGLPRYEATRVLDEAAAKIYDRAGRYIYGEGETDLAAVVLDLLRARGLTLGVAESCTGGLLGARVTAVPGSSDIFRGGTVAYANDVKVRALGVPESVLAEHGAVSEAVAARMAAAARETTGSDVGVGITGVAGPGGGTPEKPVGLIWVAVETPATARAFKRVYVGDREEIRLRATQAALDMIRRLVQDGA